MQSPALHLSAVINADLPVRPRELKRSEVRERGHPNRLCPKIKEAQKFKEIEEETKYYEKTLEESERGLYA